MFLLFKIVFIDVIFLFDFVFCLFGCLYKENKVNNQNVPFDILVKLFFGKTEKRKIEKEKNPKEKSEKRFSSKSRKNKYKTLK